MGDRVIVGSDNLLPELGRDEILFDWWYAEESSMTVDEHMEFWINGAEHDLDAAKSLLASGKYDWCLFLAHLVLEKALKALYVRDNQNQMPPRTHDLVKLAAHTKVVLSGEQRVFLMR